ncbi:MAG: ATP-binding protein [Spirochaetia bacterium]|nr:ATP-binding protein [Spirochaetia bacterium]
MPRKAEMQNNAKISRLNVEAAACNLRLIRKFIGDSMKNEGFPRRKISAMAVSVTEHCENLIRHAYRKKSGKVALALELKYPEAKLTALDSGPRFNMLEQKLPDTSQRLKKGLGGKMGIKTILASCDAIGYKRMNGCNENTFIVRVKKPGKVKKINGNDKGCGKTRGRFL